MQLESPKEKSENRHIYVKKEILPKFDEKHMPTNLRNSTNPKKDKYKENHI